ncbi:2OG-Fe dioxygenase family protein [Undibacterium sp. SXout20W]|uniref:2OG-Fe dioxygenase family protein n=1 Tax=Undibacterium sp. SXout20W TaxID=3413051 RepID=UPI003BF3E316
MTLNESGFKIIQFPKASQKVIESFSDLGPDIYLGSGNRTRRFAQYRMTFSKDRWEFARLPHRPYMTFSKYNKVAGGIERNYEPLKIDITQQIEFCARSIPLDTESEWQINVHQYRVIVRPDLAGITVPEGPHQDGHEFVGILVFNRHRIEGAEMRLLALGGVGEPFYKYTLLEGEAALLNDRTMFHDVTEIKSLEKNGSGYRDIVVVAFSRWEERWYGKEFEEKAHGNLA